MKCPERIFRFNKCKRYYERSRACTTNLDYRTRNMDYRYERSRATTNLDYRTRNMDYCTTHMDYEHVSKKARALQEH